MSWTLGRNTGHSGLRFEVKRLTFTFMLVKSLFRTWTPTGLGSDIICCKTIVTNFTARSWIRTFHGL